MPSLKDPIWQEVTVISIDITVTSCQIGSFRLVKADC